MHIGTAQAVQDRRAATVDAFRMVNPQRFTCRPRLPELPAAAWINKPDQEGGPPSEESAA
ncbi:hypothetical protein [Sinosporangium album]|uniref:hypothetical protein n=1 Tax=Sinosporangium album TaxID=504805 RepID=UPI001FE06E20|nr:hypothetical protein [Sinosporangium album]